MNRQQWPGLKPSLLANFFTVADMSWHQQLAKSDGAHGADLGLVL
jgi:hypothetical protein